LDPIHNGHSSSDNHFMKFIFILIIVFTQISFAQSFVKLKDWRYLPADEGFWTLIEKSIKEEDFKEGFKIIEGQINKSKSQFQRLETYLALGSLCRKLNYSGCSFVSFMHIIKSSPSSMPAMQALLFLSEDNSRFPQDEEELSRIINTGSFKEIPEQLNPMVNYFIALDNLKKGKKQWAQKSAAEIPSHSYWGLRIQFFNAIYLIKEGKINESLNALNQLIIPVEKYPILAHSVKLQKARILFELKQFSEAEEIYKNFNSADRDFGRTILERAWIQYYLKDFSLALGMLESLKTPFFKVSVSPEQYILSLLIYRDLCHYESATDTSKVFNIRFKSIHEHLKSRKPLNEQVDLMRMVLLQPRLLSLANLVNEITQEKQKIIIEQSLGSTTGKLLNTLSVTYSNELRGRINRRIVTDLEKKAEHVLEVSEQMKILDYIVNLDKFRLQQTFENRSYKTEFVERFAIDKLYWPITDEAWWDELPKYRVLLEDRCKISEIKK